MIGRGPGDLRVLASRVLDSRVRGWAGDVRDDARATTVLIGESAA